MEEVAVFGGTFNPFHNAELDLATRAFNQFGLDRLIFMPNGNPPHKKDGVMDRETRFELVSAAVSGINGFEVSRLEIDRPGITWTLDTLRLLKKSLSRRTRLSFIMGADNVTSLRDYEKRAQFLRACRLLIAPRQGAELNSKDQWQKALPKAKLESIDFAEQKISSTEIRMRLARGEDISHLVPPAVWKIIQERGLFQRSAVAS